MRVLVTGGAGFIGHHLVRAFEGRGDDVVVIDDLSSGRLDRIADLNDRIKFVEGSILDDAALDIAMADRDVVLHEAALASVARSVADPVFSENINVVGTIRVMMAAARHGVERLVFAGSSAVYGIPDELPCRENATPAPESPYGVSKLAAEHYVHTLGRQLGVGTVSLRYFNVFGPGQDPQSEYAAVVPRFVSAVLRGERPTINGSGEISRDFVYIDNVVHANLLAVDAEYSGLTCNVASARQTSLLELLDAICRAAGRRVEPLFGPPRAGDIQHSVADISVARTALGYDNVVPFEDGITRTVDWMAHEISA